MSIGDLMVVKQNKDYPTFIRIDKIPVSMVASMDKSKLDALVPGLANFGYEGLCNDRYFENLPGFIDAQTLTFGEFSDGSWQPVMLSEPNPVAFPIC